MTKKKKKLRCVESDCLYNNDGGCIYEWAEEPPPVPRGQLSREYCHQYAEKAGDEIRISMSAYQ